MTILLVPTPSCPAAVIGEHVAAASGAGHHVEVAAVGPLSAELRELYAGLQSRGIASVASVDFGWSSLASNGQLVVVADTGAYSNAEPRVLCGDDFGAFYVGLGAASRVTGGRSAADPVGSAVAHAARPPGYAGVGRAC